MPALALTMPEVMFTWRQRDALERVAGGDDGLAEVGLPCAAEDRGRRVQTGHAQQHEVGAGARVRQRRVEPALAVLHADGAAALDDVVVGEHVAARVDDETAAGGASAVGRGPRRLGALDAEAARLALAHRERRDLRLDGEPPSGKGVDVVDDLEMGLLDAADAAQGLDGLRRREPALHRLRRRAGKPAHHAAGRGPRVAAGARGRCGRDFLRRIAAGTSRLPVGDIAGRVHALVEAGRRRAGGDE